MNNEQLDNQPETPDCTHENKAKKVLQVYCTCEVTAVFCKDCGKQLGAEQWDC
ncbi:hypothetical protein ACILD6_00140 [Capnocytophaga canimorsus]|uniref:hypothetical protein n=1 Tax=Capnocytophaga canimorsus TaxID=28188 RepID=UPI0037CD2D27